jgi:ubiquinone/menaquinone biosynthesis C-methylase UbiE
MGRKIMNKAEGKTKRENVNQHYEEQWQGYTEEDVLKRVENLKEVLDSILSLLTLKPGVSILDLGSGPGIIPLRMAQFLGDNPEVRVYGLEISENAIKLGKKIIKQKNLTDSIYLIKGDAENLPFQYQSYDIVVSNATFNLLLDKEKGFNEMTRVVKEGGEIIIADCVAKVGKRFCGDTDTDDELWSACVAGAPTKVEIQQLANRTGLEVLETSNLTHEVSRLVKNKLWEWPEFIEYDLEYYIFKMGKRESR